MTVIDEKLNFALPNGHLMVHVMPFLEKAGLNFDGYNQSNLSRRPILTTQNNDAKTAINNPNMIAVKVIRPQDMPTHVANANFDIAISGTDWLAEHKLRFPKSPVSEILRLKFGKVKIVSAVHQNHGKGKTLDDYMRFFHSKSNSGYLKIASEYVYIADNYAQTNNLNPYKIIMTYGATESLIPEDCDMIIENTETGNTLQKNNLKIIDVIMESEACLIVSAKSLEVQWKKNLIENIQSLFSKIV